MGEILFSDKVAGKMVPEGDWQEAQRHRVRQSSPRVEMNGVEVRETWRMGKTGCSL